MQNPTKLTVFMDHHIKKVSLILTPILLLLSGCTFVTSHQSHRIGQSSRERTIEDDSTRIYVPINGTTTSKTIFPLIYDIDTRKEPYRCHFTIWGHFKEITSASAVFILNGKIRFPLALNVTNMNNGKKLKTKSGRTLFPAGGFDLPYTWDEIETLEMEIHFIAIDSEGNSVEYEEKKTFTKRLNERKGNRTWDAMMSV